MDVFGPESMAFTQLPRLVPANNAKSDSTVAPHLDPLTSPRLGLYSRVHYSAHGRPVKSEGVSALSSRLWKELTAGELVQAAESNALVLVPVGATEQHGPHLATGVDELLATEVCRRLGERLSSSRPVIITPSLWLGLSEHHMRFGGTFTVGLATYQAVLNDICESIHRAGFGEVLIVNGHGGNMTALNALVSEISRTLPIRLAVATYATFNPQLVDDILEDQPCLMHACEGETSLMMAAYPQLVRADRVAEAVGPDIPLPHDSFASVFSYVSLADISPNGVGGNASKASAAKGEKLFEAFVSGLATAIEMPKAPQYPSELPGTSWACTEYAHPETGRGGERPRARRPE